MTIRSLVKAWDRFFFSPQTPEPMALYRILYSLLVLVNSALIAPDLFVWYGERGAISANTAYQMASGVRINLLYLLPHTNTWVVIFFVFFNLCAVSLLLGFFTRTSAALVFIGLVSLHHRNMAILNSGDTFLRLAAFYLLLSQAGAVWSIDRWRRIRSGKESPGEPKPVSPWAQRLFQIQISLVYLATFVWKVDGATWVNGTAGYYTSRLEEFWRFPTFFMSSFLPLIKFGTWFALAVEFALGFLIWFEDIRYYVLAGGVLLHLWIEYSMNIPLFSFIMIASYVTFLKPEHVKKIVLFMRQKCGEKILRSRACP